jgi:beta-glucosidase
MTWGVDDLSVKERIQKVIEAGVDQFGGNSNSDDLIDLYKENIISESRINESARRLLRAKFKMGLFDNPYIDVDKVEKIIGGKDYVEKGKLAQRKSIVMLKNQMNADSSNVLPLGKSNKIYIENIDKEIAGQYATVVDNLEEADFAVLRLQTPWVVKEDGNFFDNLFHQGDLDFKEPELSRILNITRKKPTIICLYLDRAAVVPEIAETCVGLFGEFGAYDDAVLDIIFGKYNPTAILPFELPSSMEAVRNQYEDVPYDSKNPLFEFGFGLTY